MNCRTAEQHPDHEIRVQALARVQAYETALSDLAICFKEE
jgi:hypothetical protein